VNATKRAHTCLVVSLPLLLWVSFFGVSYAAGLDDNIAKIQKAYEGVRDLRGSFFQKSVIRDLDRTETYQGDFFIKPPLKMKWMYKGKTAQDLIINNDTVLIVKKGENQAYKSRFDRATYGQTPVALLSGFGNIREEFTVSGKDDTLMLLPKRPMGNITSIRITLSDTAFPIRSFVITDTYSNEIHVELKHVRINTGLQDSLFDLTLPKGMHVFEQ
jgi:outer membrane lipoprotein carrier protein